MDVEGALLEIVQLPVSERVSFAQRILDSITEEMEETSELKLPAEYRSELDRRIAEGDAHPERGIPWEVVEEEAIHRESR